MVQKQRIILKSNLVLKLKQVREKRWTKPNHWKWSVSSYVDFSLPKCSTVCFEIQLWEVLHSLATKRQSIMSNITDTRQKLLQCSFFIMDDDSSKKYLATKVFCIHHHRFSPLFWNSLTFHEKSTLFLGIYVLEWLVLGYPFSEILGTHMIYICV